MEWSILLSVYAASIVLGLSVAAPIGPINIEIIRRGLTQGPRAAFAMGCGAVSVDCIYFSLALAGAGLVSAMSDSEVWRVLGLSLGSGMLIWLGVGAIRKGRSIQAPPPGMSSAGQSGDEKPPARPSSIYLLGLALTLSNPMTIALWLSIAAGFAASGPAPGAPIVRLAGVGSGAIGWVCLITTLTAVARRWINRATMRAINLFSGLILAGYGVWFFARIFMAP